MFFQVQEAQIPHRIVAKRLHIRYNYQVPHQKISKSTQTTSRWQCKQKTSISANTSSTKRNLRRRRRNSFHTNTFCSQLFLLCVTIIFEQTRPRLITLYLFIFYEYSLGFDLCTIFSQNERQLKLSQVYSTKVFPMKDLFTFNSEQFRMIQPPPNTSRSISKRFLSNFGIRRTSSLRSDSTACEHLQFMQGTKAGCKKVQFDLFPFSKMKKHSSQVESFLEEIVQKPQKIVQKNSKRYYELTDNKKSLQLERRNSFEEKIQNHKVNASMDAENFHRKQKRAKSFRLGPKIIIPISDRKLPKVFKMNSPIYQPHIASENQSKRKLVESRQVRESFSSQKARVILKYGENVFKITKKQPQYNESQTHPEQI